MSRVAKVVCALIVGATTAKAQDSLASRFARVDSLLRQQYPSSEPGAVVGVVLNGALVFVGAHGMADLEAQLPMEPGTPFNVMSVAKQFTAASVALLVERGALSLDDDVRQHIPELPDFGTPIRVRHLIHHTSGLRDIGALWTLAGSSPEEVRGRAAHLAVLGRQQRLNFVPGTEYSYTNSGYILLALIVERVSGQSFTEFTERHLFAPLRMVHSAFAAAEPTTAAPAPPSYRRDTTGSWIRLVSRDRRTGASDLVSTIPDLARWVIGLEQSRVGGQGFASSLESRGTLVNGDTIAYAFGNIIDRHEGFREILHSGGLLGTRCKISRFPQRSLGLIYCGNGSPAHNDTFYAIANIMLLDAPLPRPRASNAARRSTTAPGHQQLSVRSSSAAMSPQSWGRI
jgi:CubicO group peptidase (beta-lactamase class C family)